jgi:nitrate reductase gamma subunit
MNPTLLKAWMITVVVFSVIDVIITYALLSVGHIEEANLLPRWMIKSFGVEMALLVFSPLITLTSLLIVVWGCRQMLERAIVGEAALIFQKTRRRAYFYLGFVLTVKAVVAVLLLWYLAGFLITR